MENKSEEVITLAGGCFWCLEAVFQKVAGVNSVESGYSNGKTPNPTYQLVCSGGSGYAEVVKINFNPYKVTLKKILEIFFSIHDPTTKNRQGNDCGSQYRSGIYPQNQKQLDEIKLWLKDFLLNYHHGENPGNITTEIELEKSYYPAEAYHQNYFNNNPNQGYCQMVIQPKVLKFEKVFNLNYFVFGVNMTA